MEGGDLPLQKRKRETRKANYINKILNNDKATKSSSFIKRKPTLKKKASELQTLCDVSVCVVCYDADGNVDTWPENRSEVVSLINDYKKAQEKRGSDIIGFSKLKKKKLADKFCEEMKRNLSKLFDGRSLDGLDSKLKSIKERMENLGQITPMSENFNVNAQPGPEVEQLATMVDNREALELNSRNPPVEFVANTVLLGRNCFGDAGTRFGAMLEGSDLRLKGYINSNPIVGFVGDKDLASTSYKPYEVSPEGYSLHYNLGRQNSIDNGAISSYKPYSQFASSSDAAAFGFSELLLRGYTGMRGDYFPSVWPPQLICSLCFPEKKHVCNHHPTPVASTNFHQL